MHATATTEPHSIRQAADRLGYTYRHVKRLIAEGEVAADVVAQDKARQGLADQRRRTLSLQARPRPGMTLVYSTRKRDVLGVLSTRRAASEDRARFYTDAYSTRYR